MGPSKVGDVVTSSPWTTFGLLSHGFSQQNLPHQFLWGILDTWPKSIFLTKQASSGLFEINVVFRNKLVCFDILTQVK